MNKNKLILVKVENNKKAETFCEEFINSDKPKYIFGRNELSVGISKLINVNGYIDDFTKNQSYLGKPIVNINDIPNNALVVSVITGKPFTAENRLKKFKFEYLDYFSFYKYSKLNINQVMFWDGMIEDINTNRYKYEEIYTLLEDDISKQIFNKIVNFRLSYNLKFMDGFEDIEDKQYFEDFLNLKNDDEVFVDVGGYDGYTSEEFIKRVSTYSFIHIFEPEEKNLLLAKDRLSKYENICYHQIGLSNKKETLRFDINGSSSKISNNGDIVIEVDKLDDVINERVSFIKMDIEGSESLALEGAENIIKKYHPKLAISVYHKANDFWKIPEQIFNIRSDYKIYMRHYTEGISETIMFFIPNSK